MFDFVTVGFVIFMAAKGLRYQALMTSLNGVRFSFNCSFERVLVGTFSFADFNGHWDGDCFLYLDSKDATIVNGKVLLYLWSYGVFIVSIGIF